MRADQDRASGVGSRGYRWYVAAQVVSIVGTMMGYTALYWLALHLADGHAAVLSAVVAAESLPMLLFSRRAGTIVGRHRAVQVIVVTQSLQAAGSLVIGILLLTGWLTSWYLVPLSFAIGCVQSVDVPARQTFMLDLVGRADLRRGTSLYATITGLAKIAGPAVAGIIIAATGETAVFFADAASFLGVIAVLVLASGDVRQVPVPNAAAVRTRRFRWVLDLPPGIRAAAAMALLLGGFGLQFGVTNPLMAGEVFHIGAVGFGLFGTSVAVGGIAGNYYSSWRGDPGPSEFLVWAVVFGTAECLAAIMPVAWAYDLSMIVIGGATQLCRQCDRLRPAGHAGRPAEPCAERLQRGLHGLRPGRRLRRGRAGRGGGRSLGPDGPRPAHRHVRGRPALRSDGRPESRPQIAGRVILPARGSQLAASHQQPRRLTWYRQARR